MSCGVSFLGNNPKCVIPVDSSSGLAGMHKINLRNAGNPSVSNHQQQVSLNAVSGNQDIFIPVVTLALISVRHFSLSRAGSEKTPAAPSNKTSANKTLELLHTDWQGSTSPQVKNELSQSVTQKEVCTSRIFGR